MSSPFLFVIILVSIACLTIIILAAMFRDSGNKPKKRGKASGESTEDLQELVERCHKLSARIESLETIIIQNERNSKSKSND